MELVELEKKYNELRKSHKKLPTFETLNLTFEVGKVERDTGTLLRDIRRLISEKISHYVRLLELMHNPSQASPVFLILLKEIRPADKVLIDSLITRLVNLELASYRLDLTYQEVEEVAFIIRASTLWQEELPNLTTLLAILDRNWSTNDEKKPAIKSKAYFN